MATGIETAGIVLAVLPMFVQMLGAYLDATGNHRCRKALLRELRVESALFKNTCGTLLEGLGADKVTRLLDGDEWNDPGLLELLGDRLGRDNAKLFVEYVQELSSSLSELGRKLGFESLDGNMKPAEHLQPSLWEEIKLSFKKGDLLGQIHDTNRNLARLAKVKAFQLPNLPVQTKAAENYNRIRNHAKSLHATFLQRFQVGLICRRDPHDANLSLQMVSVDTACRGFKFTVVFSNRAKCNSTAWIWREIQFEPIDAQSDQSPDNASLGRQIVTVDVTAESRRSNSKISVPFSPPKEKSKGLRRMFSRMKIGKGDTPVLNPPLKEHRETQNKVSFNLPNKKPATPSTSVPESIKTIQNLCETIDKAGSATPSVGCLGILDSDNGSHLLWPPTAPPSSGYTRETVSLDELLLRGNMDIRDRLRLAVQLASGVMQLHATGWLDESWGKRDIRFFLRDDLQRLAADGNWYHVHVADKPFLRRNFGQALGTSLQSATPAAIGSPLVQYDRSLFSLGIVLVELWFGKRLEDLPEYPQALESDSGSNKDNLEYQTANQLLDTINCQEGPIYSTAVRRCIRGLDCHATSLEQDELKNQAHAEVVSELERHWKAYDDRAK